MVFFFISAPELMGSREATIKEIREMVIRKNQAEGRELASFERSKFKLANLDTLMFCNDKILKLENLVEGFLKKIDKQYLDLIEKPSHEWYVRGGDKQVAVKGYCYEFKWNQNKYPRTYPIPKIVQLFEQKLNTVEGQLRNKTNSLNQTKILLNQNTQKDGNYNVKDLTDVIVQPYASRENFQYTKFITTLVAIVPKIMIEEFQSTYDLLTDNVIPYSAKQLKVPEKDGLTIWTINIFTEKIKEDQDEEEDHKGHKKDKRNLTPVAEFIEKAREKLKITVRQFKFESGQNDSRKKKRQGLQNKLKAQVKAVCQICLAYFSQIYELYIHTKLMRIVIESSMRFGSDKTVIYCIEPATGKQKQVQALLVSIFGDKESEGLYGTKDEIDDGEDFFPFIYVPGIAF